MMIASPRYSAYPSIKPTPCNLLIDHLRMATGNNDHREKSADVDQGNAQVRSTEEETGQGVIRIWMRYRMIMINRNQQSRGVSPRTGPARPGSVGKCSHRQSPG